MTLSVNSNTNALVTLATLTTAESQTSATQSQAGAGAASTTAATAAWSIAQGQSADALDSVKGSLNRASSISDVASAAGQSVLDLLNQVKSTVAAGTDTSLSTSARTTLNSDYTSLLSQISDVVNSATFDGANILNGSLSGNIKFLASSDGASTVTLSAKDLSVGGPNITLDATSSISTPTAAAAALTQVNQSLSNVTTALSEIGSQANEITAHNGFVGALSDALQTGVGNLVNADLSKEGAKLQALQIQQQLSGQSLSIANQGPQVVLSLFK